MRSMPQRDECASSCLVSGLNHPATLARDALYTRVAGAVHDAATNNTRTLECIIANTDTEKQRGSHWITVMIEIDPIDPTD